MKKVVNKVSFNLSTERKKFEFIVPNRFLYILSCPGDFYISVNDKDDDMINLKNISFIDLSGASKLYITNPSSSGTVELLFTSLLKIEFTP
ncbi:MAG TPA: hypothetical protein DCG38_05080 [Eubacteriaceae bacterium]|nr:hypothetical protein [Eubacteriaceae bacterium]